MFKMLLLPFHVRVNIQMNWRTNAGVSLSNDISEEIHIVFPFVAPGTQQHITTIRE